MATIKLKSIKEGEASVNFSCSIHKDGVTGYETDVKLHNKHGQGWVAEVVFDNMPKQETPEKAIERLGLYLTGISKIMKGRNIKHLNLATLFDTVHK